MTTQASIEPIVASLLAKLGSTDEGFNAVVDLAVLVAAADGKIDKAEHAALADSLAALFGARVAPQVARHVVGESKRALAAQGVEARAQIIGAVLLAGDAVTEGLRVALAIAYASEGLSDAERAHIDLVARAAGAGDSLVSELADAMKPA